MSTTITHIEKKKLLIPKLRFKGFANNQVLTKSISDLLNDDKKITYGIVQPGDYDPNGVIMIRSQDYSTGWNELSTMYKVSNSIDKPYQRSRVIKDDIIITVVGGNVGKLAVVPDYLDNSNISRSVARISIKKNLAVSKYVNYFLEKKISKLIFLNQVGGAQPVLNLKELSQFIIPCPTLPEQQKIASFLSAVDEKIQQLTRKKELLEQYKKGVMQQLFSGKLRFRDENGKAFPKWDMVGGDKLFDSISDKKHNSDLPILAITQDQGAIPRDLINYQMSVTDASIASYKVVQVGDFIISLRTFQGGIEYSNYKGICSPAYNILRPSSNNVNREFYKYYLKTPYYIKQLQKNLEGIRDGKMISYKYFSEIKLPFPSVDEQIKIANYLSKIDNKLERVTKQITKTQTFKKGLLQQMFV